MLGNKIKRELGVTDHGLREMLIGVEAIGVERNEPNLRITENAPGAGDHIREPSSDIDEDVGVCRKMIAGVAAHDADRGDIERMRMRQGRAAHDRLGDGYAELFRKRRKFLACPGIMDAAAGDDQRLLRRSDDGGR